MTIQTWLSTSLDLLSSVGIETARLDCLVLLEDIIGHNRAWILAHPENELSTGDVTKLSKAITRRESHEPLAYIRGKAEFYGREFIINHDVLVPRPESEDLIDLLKEYGDEIKTIVDIGTGSGCLAITAMLERVGKTVIATDMSTYALGVASQNAQLHKTNIIFYRGDLITALPDVPLTPWGIVANLPYVPEGYAINRAASHEPTEALFAGTDGLDDYRTLFGQLPTLALKPSFVICESLPTQHAAIATLAKKVGFSLAETREFGQCFTQTQSGYA